MVTRRVAQVIESPEEEGVGRIRVGVATGGGVVVAGVGFPALSRKQAVNMNSMMRRRKDAFFMECMDTFHSLIRKTVVAASVKDGLLAVNSDKYQDKPENDPTTDDAS